MNSSKRKLIDKKTVVSSVDSTMDMLMMKINLFLKKAKLMKLITIILTLLMSKSPKLLKPTMKISAHNSKLTKSIMKLKSQVFFMEDILEITMLEEIHGIYFQELWQDCSTEVRAIF